MMQIKPVPTPVPNCGASHLYFIVSCMKPPPIVSKPTAVFRQSGPLEVGKGKITGVVALTLGGLAVMSVLAFHFPEYLTTPNLRKQYDVNLLREIMLVGMVIAG
ncbi:MAG: hypothetical protein KIT82_21180, partial [Bradyrhizobium sp.]|nr:hypothetical protein [Bradyrhizobium sp.]